MRNALTPVITLGALELGTLLSGAVLTEQIFSIPGFGKLIVDAVFNRDYAVVQGVVLVTATIYITLNLIADIAYILVNPRLRAIAHDRRRTPRPLRIRARRTGEPGAAGLAAADGSQGSGGGMVVIATFVVLALFAPLIAPYDPVATSWTLVRKAPSALHWFGTDDLGRDILSRVIYGARASLVGRRDLGRDCAWDRRAVRAAVGLPRRLHRRADQPYHRRDAGLPVPDPGHRAGGVSRPEPRQCHDRHRHLDDADLRAADPRARP